MDCTGLLELRRRTIIKSLLWRLIGIVWTWVGAYLILLLTPQRFRVASLMATAIVIYHHSTRMIMYYLYERIWSKVRWGRVDENRLETVVLSPGGKLIWTLLITLSLTLIFFLIFYVSPMMKK